MRLKGFTASLNLINTNHVARRQDNRDKRVELLQRYARKFFPATRYLDYAQRVEAYTLTKAANLVMNVDVRPAHAEPDRVVGGFLGVRA